MNPKLIFLNIVIYRNTCSVTVMIVENGHSNRSSNPEQGCLHFP